MTGRDLMTLDTGRKVYTLPAALDAEAAHQAVQDLNRFSPGDDVVLDAAKVTSVSFAYLQVVLAAMKSLPKLSVIHESPALVQAFLDFGLAAPAAYDPPVTEPAPPPLPEIEPTQAKPAMSKKILTIDDSRTMRDMLKMTLADAGFTVVQAVDGQDGLNVLAKEEPFDVIITDINMPKLDGYGVIREVRKNPSYDDTPILVLSTESEQENKDKAKDIGATGWIVKPFDPEVLVQVIQKVCP
jgi:two-component system chemotaxis response regulator CheY